MATITVEGLDKVVKKLGTISNIEREMRPPMQKTLDYLHRRLAAYPPKAAGAFSAMATPAQKRAYWAKVRSGRARHTEGGGYVRSNHLANHWRKRVQIGDRRVTGELSNGVQYARYVYGRQRQPFHRASGFPTVDEFAERESGVVRMYFDAAIKRIISK